MSASSQRRGGDGGRGAARDRLEQEGGRGAGLVHLAELVARLEEELAVGDGDHLRHAVEVRRAQERLLQQALAIGEADERLGMELARDGPQPRARAAAKDGRYQHALALEGRGRMIQSFIDLCPKLHAIPRSCRRFG
jgi:hypothetical protein